MIKSKLSITLGYLKRYRGLSVAIFIFTAFGSFLEVFSVGLLFPIFQGILGSENMFQGISCLEGFGRIFAGWDRKDLLTVLLAAFFVAFAAKSVIFYMGNISISKQRFLLTRDLQNELFGKLMDAGVSFYDSTKSGGIVNSIYNETVRIGNFINCVLRVAALSARTIVNAGILLIISWKFTIVAFVAFFIIRFPLHLVMNRIRHIGFTVNKAIADLTFTVLEAVNGVRIIKMFSAEKRERTKFSHDARTVYDLNYSNIKNAELILPMTQIAFFGIFILFFLIVIRATNIEVAKLLPYIAAYVYVSKNVLGDFATLQDRRAEAASYIGSFDSYNAMTEKINSTIIPDGKKEFSALKNEIRFENVSFGYNPDKTILHDISFSIPRNKATALVGYSGSGKTTLAYLLLRFYDAQSGRILVDGTDIRDLNMGSWRSRIGFVSQDVFIFNASAKDNIAYGRPDAGIDEVRRAARAAEIDEYISSLPHGYDTVLGERGVKLSGGQRQRISIARALMQNPDILILDEATSHLDTKTEQQIQHAIENLSKDRTTIVIAHRLSTVVNSDKIVVFEAGRLIEEGTHQSLLAHNGIYKNLYHKQSPEGAREII